MPPNVGDAVLFRYFNYGLEATLPFRALIPQFNARMNQAVTHRIVGSNLICRMLKYDPVALKAVANRVDIDQHYLSASDNQSSPLAKVDSLVECFGRVSP